MNFFQFAQSSKSKPPSNAFASSPPSFIQFPTIANDEAKSEAEKITEGNNAKSEVQNNSILDQSSKSPFIFNPKKVTFANPEANKPIQPSIKANQILLSQSQSNAPQILSGQASDIQITKKNDEMEYDDQIISNNEEITSDNLAEQMTRLEKDFKLISSWSQKQMSSLQQLQEEINISSLKGNELLASINSILNS